MKLRPYQQEAHDAIVKDINLNGGNSLVVMPTGSGKSHVIASTAALSDTVLILQPSQELLFQNREKLSLIIPKDEIGTYSASFNERTIKKFTFATIQSVYKKPELFQHIKLVLLDECHNLAPKNLSAMYTSFFEAIDYPKVIGFTATPYRLELGYYKDDWGTLYASTMLKLINRMRSKDYIKNGKRIRPDMFWKRIIYNISHQKLLDGGYLAPLEYIHEPLMPYTEIPVNQSNSDYNLEAYTETIIGKEAQILSSITEAQKRYKSILVFCSTVPQAEKLSATIKKSACVLGSTPTEERKRIVEGFKNGTIQTVFNVGTLTTGFDKPDLDCVILLRPTRSPILYNQMLGRLSRTAPGKEKGTVIDLTDTCKAMGRIETFELYQNERNLWDLRTERHQKWHDKVLFKQAIQQND